MAWQHYLAVSTALLLIFITNCLAQENIVNVVGELRCHQCWTKDDDLCGSWETLSDPDLCLLKDNVCKKLVTKYYKVIKKGQKSTYDLLSNVTSRYCGQADWTGCRTIKGAASTSTECVCDKDGCNGVERHLAAAGSVLLFAIFVPILLRFR